MCILIAWIMIVCSTCQLSCFYELDFNLFASIMYDSLNCQINKPIIARSSSAYFFYSVPCTVAWLYTKEVLSEYSALIIWNCWALHNEQGTNNSCLQDYSKIRLTDYWNRRYLFSCPKYCAQIQITQGVYMNIALASRPNVNNHTKKHVRKL